MKTQVKNQLLSHVADALRKNGMGSILSDSYSRVWATGDGETLIVEMDFVGGYPAANLSLDMQDTFWDVSEKIKLLNFGCNTGIAANPERKIDIDRVEQRRKQEYMDYMDSNYIG